MKTLISLMMFVVLLSISVEVKAQHLSQTELPMEKPVGWNILPNGMLVVEYDLDDNGKSDFFTVHVVTGNYFSNEALHQIRNNYPASLIFNVAYETDNYIYITTKNPLFYGIDCNEDGLWDVEYKDVMEDGINGNEKYYGSPSGMNEPEELNDLKKTLKKQSK